MKRKKNIIIIICFTIVLTFFCFHTSILPQNDNIRISQLEDRISDLEERVNKLEQMLLYSQDSTDRSSNIINTTVVQTGWENYENWMKIKVGMSFEQVKDILGSPTSTDMTDERMGTWFYEGYVNDAKAKVSGYVYFSSGKVQSVLSPGY